MGERIIIIAIFLGLMGTSFIAGRYLVPVPVQSLSDAEYSRAKVVRQEQLQGENFDNYIYSHPDTPGPEIKFPEIDTLDPTIWDWIDHTMLQHDKLLTYWATDYPVQYVMTHGTTGTYVATCSGSTYSGIWTNSGGEGGGIAQ